MVAPVSMCWSMVPHNTSLSESGCEDGSGPKKTWSLSGYMFVLVVGHMLHGAGATPVFTLAVTYLDDNVKAKVTPLYLGQYTRTLVTLVAGLATTSMSYYF